MSTQTAARPRIPSFVGLLNPLAAWLLQAGLPLGPNALLTVRGRKSGLPRTTPVALVEVDGRAWVSSPYGEVHWVRNLRDAGQGTIRAGRRSWDFEAVELGTAAAAGFFRDVMGPYVARIPLGMGKLMISSVLGAPEMVSDPELAARLHPVFELRRPAAS
jgi:deazaflavin-dependent oxidoreductase (nitroreductase family)